MRLWMILLSVLLVVWLVSMVRVGAAVRYDGAGLFVALKAGPFRPKVYPFKKTGKAARKAAEGARKTAVRPTEKGGSLSLVRKFLPLVAEAAGRVKDKIRIDRIELELVWGAADPAAAAMGYGMANAALGMLWPLIEHNFNVRERQLKTAVDFDAAAPAVSGNAELSFTVGQGLTLGAVLGAKAFKLLRSHKKEQKLKEAV